jgi:hypothetical protein
MAMPDTTGPLVAWPTVPLHTLAPVAAETPKTVPLAGRP